MKKYLIIAIVLLLIAVAYQYKSLSNEKSDRQRQEENVETLNEGIKRYAIRDSLNVISVSSLNYTINELKKYHTEDVKLIEDLKLRPKDVEEIIKTEIITKDSLIYKVDSVGCFHYKDKWLKVDACISDSSMTIESRDSITQVVHTIYKYRFLWWRWKVIGLRQEIVNFNPKSKIEYSEFIKIYK